jgi:hypothetical protein
MCYYTLSILPAGLVPAANVDSVWTTVSNWGLEQLGAYGAFWYQMALTSGYYSPYYETPGEN